MRKQHPKQRPAEFRLDNNHPLAKGLFLAGLGNENGALHYSDSSARRNRGVLTSIQPTGWKYNARLGRFGLLWPGDGTGSVVFTEFSGAPSADYTFACWWDFKQSATYPAPITVNGDGIGCKTNQVGILRASDLWFSNSNAALVDNSLYHIVATRRGTTYGLYVTPIGSSTLTYSTSTSDAGWGLAGTYRLGQGYSTSCCSGTLLDVLGWDRVLSSGEISALADPSNVLLSGLIVPRRRRLFAVPATGGPAALDAEIAQTLPKLSQAVSVDVDVSVAIAQTLPKLSQAVSVDVDVSAAIAQTLPKLSQEAQVSSGRTAAIAQALPKLAQTAAADVDVSAAASQTLPKLGQSGSVDVDVSAAIAQTLPKLAQAAEASHGGSFVGAQTLPKLQQSAAVDVDVSASAAQSLPRLGQAIAVAVEVAAQINQTLPKLQQAAIVDVAEGALNLAISQTLPMLSQRVLIGEPSFSARRTFIVAAQSRIFIVS